eukprot:Skav225265  [mRNA]  locus=scaffold4099:90506:99120:+ [translate_table: standard]
MREGGYRRFLIPPQIAYREGVRTTHAAYGSHELRRENARRGTSATARPRRLEEERVEMFQCCEQPTIRINQNCAELLMSMSLSRRLYSTVFNKVMPPKPEPVVGDSLPLDIHVIIKKATVQELVEDSEDTYFGLGRKDLQGTDLQSCAVKTAAQFVMRGRMEL